MKGRQGEGRDEEEGMDEYFPHSSLFFCLAPSSSPISHLSSIHLSQREALSQSFQSPVLLSPPSHPFTLNYAPLARLIVYLFISFFILSLSSSTVSCCPLMQKRAHSHLAKSSHLYKWSHVQLAQASPCLPPSTASSSHISPTPHSSASPPPSTEQSLLQGRSSSLALAASVKHTPAQTIPPAGPFLLGPCCHSPCPHQLRMTTTTSQNPPPARTHHHILASLFSAFTSPSCGDLGRWPA